MSTKTVDEGNNEKGDGSDHDANTGSKNDVNWTPQTKNTEFQDTAKWTVRVLKSSKRKIWMETRK